MDTDFDDEYLETSSGNENIKSSKHSLRGTLPIRRKRRAESLVAPADGAPPLKRNRGDFNAAYLDLLNRDIIDASSDFITGRRGGEAAKTQIGAVVWSTAEKAAFFTAVSRLGKADQAGVAARIGTKSELEVRQYLSLLDAAAGPGEREGRGKATRKHALRPVDVPAAVEIGAECAAALEAAADALALRQESYEELVERARWGSLWRITPSLVEAVAKKDPGWSATPQPQLRGRGREEGQQRDGGEEREKQTELEDEGLGREGRKLPELPFFRLFCVPNWLQLSDRIFMNSTVSDNNWRAVSEEYEPPSIRVTAFSDFYGLAVSVTRRLLLAALYVAESRMSRKSFEEVRGRRRPQIRVEDVVAAVSSLGMKQDSREFWARCARRLQLDVADDRDGEHDFCELDEEDEEAGIRMGERTGGSDRSPSSVESSQGTPEAPEQELEETQDDELEIMSYDEVEAALGCPIVDTLSSGPTTPESTASRHTSSCSEGHETDAGKQQDEEFLEAEGDDGSEEDIKMEDQQETADDGLDLAAISLDVEEAMISLTSADYATVGTGATHAITSRVRAEHRLERDAELLDARASAAAERDLWAVLHDDSPPSTMNRRS